MAAAPDIAIRDHLDANVGALTTGTNLFEGPVQPPKRVGSSFIVPHEAVFCLVSGGGNPIEFINANQGPDIKPADVQVTVRSDVGDFAGGQSLARDVWTALQRASITGYMSVTCAQAEPIYLKQDDTEHHTWTVNVNTTREE